MAFLGKKRSGTSRNGKDDWIDTEIKYAETASAGRSTGQKRGAVALGRIEGMCKYALRDFSERNGKMLISKKQYEELLRKMEDRLEKRFQAIAGKLEEDSGKLEEMGRCTGELRTAVQKHDMAIEDLLEKLEENESEREEAGKRILECERSENLLLELFESYQEQFWNLKRFAGEQDGAWSAQLALIEEKLEHCRQLCGISVIEESGVEVNYDLHEVVEAVDTAEQDHDKLVAEIISWGYLYKGKIMKKARVRAYHVVNADTAGGLGCLEKRHERLQEETA